MRVALSAVLVGHVVRAIGAALLAAFVAARLGDVAAFVAVVASHLICAVEAADRSVLEATSPGVRDDVLGQLRRLPSGSNR